jgi:hypothetical protein
MFKELTVLNLVVGFHSIGNNNKFVEKYLPIQLNLKQAPYIYQSEKRNVSL